MRLNSGFENKKARIDMLPLIDIVFLLLVFFIYAMLSMVVHSGMKVDLISAATSQKNDREFVSVTVTDDNSIYIDEKLISIENVALKVLEKSNSKTDIPVFINGDKEADLGRILKILDKLRSAGIKEVSFNTTEDKE